eukprot:scaffold24571_cov57-Phaeocystis_antarctica.AAC.1
MSVAGVAGREAATEPYWRDPTDPAASKGVGKRPPPRRYLACRPCTVGLHTVGWRLLRHRVRALCAARWA